MNSFFDLLRGHYGFDVYLSSRCLGESFGKPAAKGFGVRDAVRVSHHRIGYLRVERVICTLFIDNTHQASAELSIDIGRLHMQCIGDLGDERTRVARIQCYLRIAASREHVLGGGVQYVSDVVLKIIPVTGIMDIEKSDPALIHYVSSRVLHTHGVSACGHGGVSFSRCAVYVGIYPFGLHYPFYVSFGAERVLASDESDQAVYGDLIRSELILERVKQDVSAQIAVPFQNQIVHHRHEYLPVEGGAVYPDLLAYHGLCKVPAPADDLSVRVPEAHRPDQRQSIVIRLLDILSGQNGIRTVLPILVL